ncbi:MAG: cobalamin biosynthesis protein CobW [Frankiales bacterium]|nr:MAG: cobalamin biosynthesis protein CobW [Frankiales bacterium]
MPFPLTVLAGLSTSLRDDLVRCAVLRRPGLAAVAYDVDPQSTGIQVVRRVVDATGTLHREVLELVGCCLSCTVRADVPEVLQLLAVADRWREVLLALPAAMQPDSVLGAVDPDVAEVDTVTTVVDAVLLREQVGGDDLLADRGLAAAPTDRRSTAGLVLGQLEESDVLAVVGLERLDTAEARTLQALLSHLAPLALQVTVGPGGVGCEDLVGTGRRDPRSTAEERERLAALAVELCVPECGVTTLRWTSERPMHSARLSAALPQVIGQVVRSRGHIWLADRPRDCVRWESAGGSLDFGDPERWRGLPQCSLVLTGVGVDADALHDLLDACLATDEELVGEPTWEDPFADALGPAEQRERA